MTRLPAEAQRISYAPEGLPAYERPWGCAHPSCDFPAVESHHVVRRSYTQGKGPQDYICIDGQVMPNKVGLCSFHHRLLTENEDRIAFGRSTWVWYAKDRLLGALSLPLIEGVAAGWAVDALDEREPEPEGALDASRSTNSEGSVSTLPGAGYGSSPAFPGSSETCPTCKRRLPKPKAEMEPTRPKSTWSIKVPVDERENGYALLRDLVEQCQVELDREGQPPYYTLIETLHFFLTTPKEKVA